MSTTEKSNIHEHSDANIATAATCVVCVPDWDVTDIPKCWASAQCAEKLFEYEWLYTRQDKLG